MIGGIAAIRDASKEIDTRVAFIDVNVDFDAGGRAAPH
jgi:hypothetical protein